MSVYLYKGGLKLVRRSGVGQAILHQDKALRTMGMTVDTCLTADTQVVHINTVFPDSLLAAVRARLHGVKVIYYAHSTMEDFRRSFCGSNVLAPLFKQWIRFCYRFGDVILTPTEYSRQLLETYGLGKKIYAISNGIDTERFCPSEERRRAFRRRYHLKEEERVVLSAGHLIERKGLLDYIDIARSMPDVQFFWFGYTEPALLPPEIINAVRTAPENLKFAGYVEQEELLEAYCGADVFAFLSKEETEGIVVLEALACKIPAVVRDIPVYEQWLLPGEHIYKANTVKEFAKLISEMLEKKLPDLTAAGREVAEERNLAAIGRKLKEIYRQEGFC